MESYITDSVATGTKKKILKRRTQLFVPVLISVAETSALIVPLHY